MKVIQGVYKGVTTSELDELAAETGKINVAAFSSLPCSVIGLRQHKGWQECVLIDVLPRARD